MATTELPRTTTERTSPDGDGSNVPQSPRPRGRQPATPWQLAMQAISSLRLTVVLLVMLTFLVFVGSLAQANHDVWYVVKEAYFRVWIAKVEFQNLATLINVFYQNKLDLPGYFYFPGGLTIGMLMAVNLLTAHAFRFRVVSRGPKLALGLLMLVVGTVASLIVLTSALSAGERSIISPDFADTLWGLLRAGYALATLAGAYGLSLLWGRIRRTEWSLLAALNGILLIVACLLFIFPHWQVDDAGMRIVWQLTKATIAGLILAGGCWLLFAKRSGVVLLHVGILVLMGHEFYTHLAAVEARMNIHEGETVSTTYEMTSREVALINRSHPEYDQVTVIPEPMIRGASEAPEGSPNRVIQHPDLPVDIRVVEYSRNSKYDKATPAQAARVTTGAGKQIAFEPAKPVSGVGEGEIDVPYAYLELLDKESNEVLAQVVVSLAFDRYLTRSPFFLQNAEQPLQIDGEPYAIGMRFRREYKPYSVTLDDFRFDRYVGTNKAKSYSSDIRLVDHELGTTLSQKVSMNNPLRYRGETFYQSGFDNETEQTTILQVVKNEGWMLPYLGCMLVAIGMMIHFLIAVGRFGSRRMREEAKLAPEVTPRLGWGEWLLQPRVWAPVLTVVVALAYIGREMKSQPSDPAGFAYREFGRLPIVQQGRMKPIDTLARNLLQSMCQRQEAATKIKARGKDNAPATRWLLDVLAGKEGWDQYYVYRIDNHELLSSMKLTPRPGFFRYTHAEVLGGFEEVEVASSLLALEGSDAKQWTPFQTDLVELYHKFVMTRMLSKSVELPMLLQSRDPVAAIFQANKLASDERIPRTIVPDDPSGLWMSMTEIGLRLDCTALKRQSGADFTAMHPDIRKIIEPWSKEVEISSAALLYENILAAYANDDVAEFNAALEKYSEAIAKYETSLHQPENARHVANLATAERLDSDRIAFEDRFNAASPFYYTAVLYGFALLLSAMAWLVAPKALGRSAMALLILTLVIHTLAIAARVYISGRPPITNIYTTLIFVGWFAVVAMLILEALFKVGIGNFVASTIGFATMLIAHFLGLDGDTFLVLQAVLDTQFWLATHVVSINVGYGATLLAGAIGIAYLIRVNILRQADKQEEQKLGKMFYGVICFALFFSFVGTVLGGLWADDSWGRFWGWDPKENGAMMIVLWNAVILHARWGGMIATRGAALLSIIGNIITAWSWFGVNQLGEGLHAYGFNDTLGFYLTLFVASQLAILAVGLATLSWSGRTFATQKQT